MLFLEASGFLCLIMLQIVLTSSYAVMDITAWIWVWCVTGILPAGTALTRARQPGAVSTLEARYLKLRTLFTKYTLT